MKTGYFVAYFLSAVTLFMFTSGDLYYSGELKKDSGKIRILSYNIRNGIGMDEVPDYDRIAHAIRRIDPDCVALQELDSATERSQGKVVLDELAKKLGMYASYGSSIDYQGGKYGIGILSKEKPLRKVTVQLPGSEEKRSLLVVELPGYVMCCTHWSLTPSDRLSSIDIINKVTEKYPTKPVFLAGDLNATPESPEIAELAKTWEILNDPSRPTFPSDNPRNCIDYIFFKKNPLFRITVLQTCVENESMASDHRPVWVDVQLYGKEEFLKSLIKESLSVRVINEGNGTIEITNHSDIAYQIRYGNLMYAVPLYPNQTMRANIRSGSEVTFTNCVIGKDKYVVTSLW